MNNTISHVAKGKIVAMLLDLEIRGRTSNEKSLADVVRYLMTNYAARGAGIPEDAILEAVEEIAGSDVDQFFDIAVRGRDELPYDRYLGHAGMRIEVGRHPSMIYFGMETDRAENNQARVRRVLPNTPAERAGLDIGDILVAVDSERITADNLSSRVRSRRIGRTVVLTVLRGERLITLDLVPEESREDRWGLLEIVNAPAEQVALRESWLGALSIPSPK